MSEQMFWPADFSPRCQETDDEFQVFILGVHINEKTCNIC
jgi:hypothetical protein